MPTGLDWGSFLECQPAAFIASQAAASTQRQAGSKASAFWPNAADVPQPAYEMSCVQSVVEVVHEPRPWLALYGVRLRPKPRAITAEEEVR